MCCSGRADDNAETIKKRLHTFRVATTPVIKHYDSEGKLVVVSGGDLHSPTGHLHREYFRSRPTEGWRRYSRRCANTWTSCSRNVRWEREQRLPK